MKRYLNLILFVTTVTLIPFMGQGQHGLNYSQFAQLRNSFNSSFSLMDPEGGAALLSRVQWVGFDGAPRAYWASGHVGIKRFGMTVGVDLKQASLGAVRDRELGGYVASAVRLSEDQYLGLSVGGGVLLHTGRFAEMEAGGDPTFRNNTNYTQGIVSLGTSYFRENRYYIGFSIPRFVLAKRDRDLEYDFRQVYYLTGGTILRIDDGLHVRPLFLVSHMEGMKTNFDLNVVAFFAQKFGLGVGVQNQGDLSGLAQFNIGDFGLGYSYQFNVSGGTANQRISNNTHEIGLRYRVGGIKML